MPALHFFTGARRSTLMATETYIGGFHAVIAWLEDNETAPREVLLLDSKHDAKSRRVAALAAGRGVTVRTISRQEMDLRAPGLRHQGVLAAVPAQEMKAEDVLDSDAGPADIVLVLDGVQDPHNLGACIRTAEAAGVRAVVVPKDRAAGLTPVVRKVAAGAAERVPVVGVTNLSRALEKLRDRGYWITGLAGDAADDEGQVARAQTLYEIDFTGPVALVMGSEGEGPAPPDARALRPSGDDPHAGRDREPERVGGGRGFALRGGAPAPPGGARQGRQSAGPGRRRGGQAEDGG